MDKMSGNMFIGFESPIQKYLSDLDKHQAVIRKITQPFGSLEMTKLRNESLIGNVYKTTQAAIQNHEKLLMGITASTNPVSIFGKNESQWVTLQQSILNDSIYGFHNQRKNLLGNAFNTIQAAIQANEKLFLGIKTVSSFDSILGNRSNQLVMLQRSIDSTTKLQKSILNDSIQGYRNHITALSDTENKLNLTIGSALNQFRFGLSKNQIDNLQIPTINNIGALLVGDIWGVKGIQNQLDALGIDFDFQSIENYDEPLDESQLAELLTKGLDWFGQSRVSGGIGLISLILSIYQIMLIHLPELSPHASEEQQEIQYVKIEKHLLEQFKPLIEQAMASVSEHSSQSEYVVKNRMAVIRSEPRNGATIVASIFPNQCVTLVSRKGKWIEIEYYDWANQKFLTGWALKKYFASIPNKYATNASKPNL